MRDSAASSSEAGPISPPAMVADILMTVERAVALAECHAGGQCEPLCPHCSAGDDESVDAARAWLRQHRSEAAAWAELEQLEVQEWTATTTRGPNGEDMGWGVALEGYEDDGWLTAGLSEHQAGQVARLHNREADRANRIINVLTGWGEEAVTDRGGSRAAAERASLEAER